MNDKGTQGMSTRTKTVVLLVVLILAALTLTASGCEADQKSMDKMRELNAASNEEIYHACLAVCQQEGFDECANKCAYLK